MWSDSDSERISDSEDAPNVFAVPAYGNYAGAGGFEDYTKARGKLIVNKRFAIDLLYSHAVEKQQGEWDLFDYRTLKSFDVEFANDVLPLNTYYHRYNKNDDLHGIVNHLFSLFPETEFFFKQCPNNIVVAGGSLASISRFGHFSRHDDVDFFFHGLNEKELEDALAKIVKAAEKEFVGRVCFTRNAYNTTIYVAEQKDENLQIICRKGRKYQFIHRSHPNMSAVIGCFDLGASMILMTADKEIFLNRMGLWSISTSTIFVDISSTSTSFGHRLTKYARDKRFALCFVCQPSYKLSQKILDGCAVFGFQQKEVTVKFGEGFYVKYFTELDRFAVIKSNKSDDSNYDFMSARTNLPITNVCAIMAEKYDMYLTFGRTYDELNSAPVLTPLKVLNRWFYDQRWQFTPLAKKYFDTTKIATEKDKMANRWLYKELKQNFEAHLDEMKPVFYGPGNHPGRQYNASFHPISSHLWYNQSLFDQNNKAKFGISDEVFTTLVLARNSGDTVFSMLSKDVFRHLLDILFMLQGVEAAKQLDNVYRCEGEVPQKVNVQTLLDMFRAK